MTGCRTLWATEHESSLQLTASKKPGSSVIQLPGNKFFQTAWISLETVSCPVSLHCWGSRPTDALPAA